MRAALWIAAVLLCFLARQGRAQKADTAKPLNLPPHPRLLIAADQIPALRQRARSVPWAKEFYARLKADGDAWLAREVKLPARGGQWWHWYACPKHGVRLRTESPTRHVCPVDGQVFTGYPYDDVVLSADHDALARAARDLGLLYQMSGDKRYAAKAREILMDYAERYLSYPLHDINGKPRVGGGRVLPQTLDESIWLISMAQGADMIWDTLSPADVETLKTRLFYPAAVDVIEKHRMSIHNIQCWKNSAVGLVGLLFGDPALVSDAIDSPHGYRAQMEKGVQADGAWYEGAWGYHFYTMDAIHDLTEAAHNCGMDLYGEAYKRMFLAPIELAMPNGQLPAFNDSGTASAKGNANYEIALARYHDPRFAALLEGSNRANLQAFLCGVDPLPKPQTEAEPPRNDATGGYAILRAGKGVNAAWLCLKYGPHGGGHGHPDKNSFVLYAGGKVLAGDPGTAAYGVPIQAGWYRTTLAHNTLLVDETSQQPATGACLDFQAKPGWCAALTDAGTALPGVTFRRAAFLLGQDVAVFIDNASSGEAEHTFDLACHPAGAWADTPPGDIAQPDNAPGYSYLRELRQASPQGSLDLALRDGTAKRWLTFWGGPPTTYLTGTGVGAGTEDRVPIVIARQRGRGALYVWAVALKPSAAPPVISKAVMEGGAHALGFTVRFGDRQWTVAANPDGEPIRIGGWSGKDRLVALEQRAPGRK